MVQKKSVRKKAVVLLRACKKMFIKHCLQRLIFLNLIKWNGKKPSGGKLLPKIEGKTVSKRILEDRS